MKNGDENKNKSLLKNNHKLFKSFLKPSKDVFVFYGKVKKKKNKHTERR